MCGVVASWECGDVHPAFWLLGGSIINTLLHSVARVLGWEGVLNKHPSMDLAAQCV